MGISKFVSSSIFSVWNIRIDPDVNREEDKAAYMLVFLCFFRAVSHTWGCPKYELFGQMKETTMKCVKIDDMEPAVFDALLHFINTGNLPNNCNVDQNVALQHLLVAADRYGLDRLKAIGEGKLCQRIDVQTVATTLALAEQHHTVHLKKACVR